MIGQILSLERFILELINFEVVVCYSVRDLVFVNGSEFERVLIVFEDVIESVSLQIFCVKVNFDRELFGVRSSKFSRVLGG